MPVSSTDHLPVRTHQITLSQRMRQFAACLAKGLVPAAILSVVLAALNSSQAYSQQTISNPAQLKTVDSVDTSKQLFEGGTSSIRLRLPAVIPPPRVERLPLRDSFDAPDAELVEIPLAWQEPLSESVPALIPFLPLDLKERIESGSFSNSTFPHVHWSIHSLPGQPADNTESTSLPVPKPIVFDDLPQLESPVNSPFQLGSRIQAAKISERHSIEEHTTESISRSHRF